MVRVIVFVGVGTGTASAVAEASPFDVLERAIKHRGGRRI